MILKGIYLAMDFHGPEGRTPPRGWRRASDTLTGGVNAKKSRHNAYKSQVDLTGKWRLI